ncbi:EAL domain-containing response regulator [Thauera linaloolentis]|uniref:Response regulator receiver modulated diguanylate cyclase/phosphodiesterase with PAS/PAC sensor(S) n=1 Tax=Thauera linaloolentis (strain DSM 12138 / JCM 21573 / CCUG 41526 / CIP 105981 / IAM 15112 / NBRC 102519 / 47Lol) TaxID=1123367 RepID=N6Y5C1_THAL4|nr:EAL domain-containing protein [Thauera linaloolentis]ENO89371.1 response regulator receiver modulated diguanylate cyclase/phosphodiesterase with PAS/PAC sensor(s) [Thauera linaloolentis 47Lol = DSM 12138]MCM8564405.1 EAL domain-containing protein [Thauera linaloolentis]
MSIPGDKPFQPPKSASPTEPDFRILIVDDDPALRRTFPHVLAHPGRSFDETGSIAEAIVQLEQQHYDLVLLDYRLPDASGLALLDWLVERRRDEAVIIISGEDAIDAAIGALRRGADDYVRKPYHVAQLQRAVEGALHKSALEKANRAMSQRLKASERLHRYLVESSPDLIFTLDAEGRFSYINPRIKPLLGFERSALMRRPFTTLIMPEDVDRVCSLLTQPSNLPGESFNVELRLRRNRGGGLDDDGITVSLTGLPMLTQSGSARNAGLYGVARDISERKRAEEIITFQAYHDQLTHLPNRVLFKDRLELAIAQAQRRTGALAVMFIDIDRFKLVNDTYGHAEGDALLRAIAARLSATLRRGDTLARLGGDEFTILLPDLNVPEDAEVIATKILDALAAPITLSQDEYRATVSVGIALFPRDGDTAEDLTRHADIAMYQVKRSGKNAFRFFDPELNTHHRERITLENDLRNALLRGEFELHYQPQVSIARRQIVGMEALLRWRHPALGHLSPNAFIQVAEELGLIGEISRWVLEEACTQLASWRQEGHVGLRMSVNMSPLDFDKRDIVSSITECLARHALPPGQMELEITESLMMNDTADVAAKVRQLRSAGLSVAIDDFGTGYSALAYLQKFPVSTLKIDRSFVRDLDGPTTNPIISAITGIARGFALDIVAEGVEQPEQAEALQLLGCDVMQGYYFARPAPAHEALEWLRQPARLFPVH